MKYTYEQITDELTGKVCCLLRSDGVAIPLDEANSDYQRYLRWVENPDADESGTL